MERYIYQSDERNSQTSRRRFLQTIGFAGIGLALSAEINLAASSKSVLEESAEASRWRERVTDFVHVICEEKRARALGSKLASAELVYAPRPTDFHSFFSSQLVFGSPTIDPEQVMCGNGFEVNRYPYYDVQCPCRVTNDLNSFEIRRVTNESEIKFYRCVLAPASRRMAMERRDLADYRRTASSYGLASDDFTVLYKRVFTGRGETYFGYHISHKTKKGSNGRPLADLLLSTEQMSV
jgi:hypothetical protein